ncbi:hypothetical protein K523DRAFT_190051, partial [Schizophyllum commune Tattone D]
EYEVERIVGHKWDAKKKKMVYRVRWAGYGPHYDLWRTEKDLKNAAEELGDYKREHHL